VIRALILRLQAPWMSFGGVIVDHHGFIDRFPGTAMLTGLIGNALGWDHADAERLQALQARIAFAARWDEPPREVVDYQTVALGDPKMIGYAPWPEGRQTPKDPGGWTTHGTIEHRKGGPDAKFGTHIRYRHYWEDGLLTLALAVAGEEYPSLSDIQQALRQPARPLFLGRKCCLPSRPLLDPNTPVVEARDVLDALQRVPRWARDGTMHPRASEPMEAIWPDFIGLNGVKGRKERVSDLRDWRAQLMTDARIRIHGMLVAKGAES